MTCKGNLRGYPNNDGDNEEGQPHNDGDNEEGQPQGLPLQCTTLKQSLINIF
ncbi:MAG: hypothetical protein RL344_178 [Pseudomonadota bacterium]|jgi:hypothetical protein